MDGPLTATKHTNQPEKPQFDVQKKERKNTLVPKFSRIKIGKCILKFF